jgi:hypothetical protein
MRRAPRDPRAATVGAELRPDKATGLELQPDDQIPLPCFFFLDLFI